MKRLFLEFQSHQTEQINKNAYDKAILSALICSAVRKCIRPFNQIEFYIDADEPNVFSKLNNEFKCPIEIRMSASARLDNAHYWTIEEGETNSLEFWGYVFIKDKDETNNR